MTVTVKLFARARDLAGTDQLEVELPDAATVGQLRQLLIGRCPELSSLGPRLLAAVNTEYADDAQTLAAGAEVAFFPPVSGG